jgi:Fur family ferric uptake transcriptional regulator
MVATPPVGLDAVGALLAAHGQRYTRGRRRLLEVLAAADQPLPLAEILRRCPEMPMSSAYRSLRILERCGVVRRILDTEGVAHVELSEAIAGHHHHVLCDGCGRMERIHLTAAVERELDDLGSRLARQWDFELREHRVELVGLCGRCR